MPTWVIPEPFQHNMSQMKNTPQQQDHKPENLIERARIEAAGGKIKDGEIVLPGISGSWPLPRAFGAKVYKIPQTIPPEERAVILILLNSIVPRKIGY